jgi:uncharacterized protein YpmS
MGLQHAFGGPWVSFRGAGFLLIVKLLLVVAVLVLVLIHDREDQLARASIMATLTQQVAQQTATTEALQEQTYVLTLKQEEREKLNLRMPPSLRAKLNRGTQ